MFARFDHRMFTAVLIGLCLTTTLHAQNQRAAPPDVVGVNDLLCIGIWEIRPTGGETLKTVRVDPQGNVSLYHVGQVKLAGLTFDQAEAAIAAAYRNSTILDNAAPSLNRLENGAAPSITSGVITAGDRLSIRIFDLVPDVQESRLLTVSAGGKVGLPLLGQFPIAGLTEAAAEQAITKALDDKYNLRHIPISVLRLGPKQTAEPTVAADTSARATQELPRANR
jgi:protein involved in polysaccharide export with SLBB domain